MRGALAHGQTFTIHTDDRARYHALPWHRRLRSLESWLRGQYGDRIYGSGGYPR